MAKLVPVYTFIKYDIASDHEGPRPVKATRETIERIGGLIIEASVEEIDELLLDGNGFYRSKN